MPGNVLHAGEAAENTIDNISALVQLTIQYGVWKQFSVKNHEANNFNFADQRVSVATIQFCHCNAKAAAISYTGQMDVLMFKYIYIHIFY